MEIDRKKEVINVCLDLFVSKGIHEASTRSLSCALKLQNSGLYYYFKSKDEAVVECFNQALSKVEIHLIQPLLRDIGHMEISIDRLISQAKEMAPTMRFILQACSSPTYRDLVASITEFYERLEKHITKLSTQFNCGFDEVKSFIRLIITAVIDYMVFEETTNTKASLAPVKVLLELLMQKKIQDLPSDTNKTKGDLL